MKTKAAWKTFCNDINQAPESMKAEMRKKLAREPFVENIRKVEQTLAATIEALGGRLEVRAHFEDADVPIFLVKPK